MLAPASAPGPEALPLEARGVSVVLGGRKVLEDAALVAPPGGRVAVLGPNGSGKTSLLLALAGFLRHGGEVRLGGRAAGPEERRQALSFLPDGLAPWGAHRLERILDLFAALHGLPGAALRERAARLGLAPPLPRRPSQLSKGERKRALLALALGAPREVVLLDEPFDGLDPRRARDVAGLLEEEAARGRTLVVSLHDMAEAARVGDRFVLLSEGRVAASGTLPELRRAASLPGAGLPELFLAFT